MKLSKIYSYNKMLFRWRSVGSELQKKCRADIIKLNLGSLKLCKLFIGGLISVGDGSLGSSCEIYVETTIPWKFVCGDILYKLLVIENIECASIILYDAYVDIKFSIDEIDYIIRLCAQNDCLRSWWVFNYLFNEVLLAPERVKNLRFLITAGVDLKTAYESVLTELGEVAVWKTLGKYIEVAPQDKILKIVNMKKGLFGWNRYERGIVCSI